MTHKAIYQLLTTLTTLLALTAYAQPQQDCVILLHGLARTEQSMTTLEKRLKQTGYFVVNNGYDSRAGTIEALATPTIENALHACQHHRPIHFVTHSMGGILVRQYLSDHAIEHLEYVVMLGPPNHGSEAVDTLSKYPGFGQVNGQAGYQLGTEPNSLPNTLGPANFHVGIIAGTRTMNVFLSSMIPGTDDGKVSVKSTQLSDMKDHMTLAVTHTFMMNDDTIIANVLHFLEYGQFCANKLCNPPPQKDAM